MEELGDISAGLTTIKQVIPLFRTLIKKAPQQGASEEFTRQLNDAVIEMQQAVIDAQVMVLASHAEEAKLRSRLQDLEQQAARAKIRLNEMSRYRLVDLGGAKGMAYALRVEFVGDDEPMHYLCTNCMEDDIKSILQQTGISIKPYDCPRCRR